jgi:hypothetical protein
MSALDKLPEHRFTEQCENLLTVTGELIIGDAELKDAARRLRDAAVVCDAMNARFEEAANEVQRLLMERIKR